MGTATVTAEERIASLLAVEEREALLVLLDLAREPLGALRAQKAKMLPWVVDSDGTAFFGRLAAALREAEG